MIVLSMHMIDAHDCLINGLVTLWKTAGANGAAASQMPSVVSSACPPGTSKKREEGRRSEAEAEADGDGDGVGLP